MRYLILILLSINAFAFNDVDKQEVFQKNELLNGGFENGKSSWVNSAGTFAIESTEKVSGSSSAKITLSSQTLGFSQSVTPKGKLDSIPLQACAYVKTSLSNVQVCSLLAGSEQNCLAVDTNNKFKMYCPTMTGPASGTIGVKVKSTTTITGDVYVDDASAGINTASLQSQVAWSGYHDDDCTWTMNSTSYVDPSADGSCTFTERKNISFGTVSSAGSKLPGITFTPTNIGVAYICANFIGTNQSASNYSQFQLLDGATQVAESQARYPNSLSTPMCGLVDITDLSSRTIKIQGKYISAGPAAINDPGSSYANAIEWTIFYIARPPTQNLVGAVLSGSSWVDRIEYAYSAGTCTSSPCTLTASSGGVTSITRSGTGSETINFSPAFAVAPVCSIISGNYIQYFTGSTTSSFSWQSTTLAGAPENTATLNIVCMGKK